MNSCFALIYRAHQHGIASRRTFSADMALRMCEVSEKQVVTSPNVGCFLRLCNLSITYVTLVYHLHGQSGPFTVWVNGSSRNCVYHYFVQISFSYRKTAAKVWNWFQRWLWRNGTRISVCPSGRTGVPFRMFRCSRKFSGGTTQKLVFHLLSNRISRNLFVNGKQPT